MIARVLRVPSVPHTLHQVHRIAILDLRVFNTDRHDGNIMLCDPDTRGHAVPTAQVRCREAILRPIDHEMCLPDYRFAIVTTAFDVDVWFMTPLHMRVFMQMSVRSILHMAEVEAGLPMQLGVAL